MLMSLALILVVGIVLGHVLKKIKLPELLGMLVAGIILGPYVLNWIDSSILDISEELRQIALIIILTRAGLNLDFADLKKVGRPAILLCFIPASIEIIGFLIFGPLLLKLSVLDSAILGTVIAAVSPAVVVPRMLKLIEQGYGTKKGIPQMIMAAGSVDDVFVIVLFTAITGIAQGGEFSTGSLAVIPISIIIGILIGLLTGVLVSYLFSKVHLRDSEKVLVLLAISFAYVTIEKMLTNILPFSGLLAIMAMGMMIQYRNRTVAVRVSSKYSKLWVFAEILLFVLVGATVDISYILQGGITAILLLGITTVFRCIGTLLCVWNTPLNRKEKVFTAIAYIPKATVQAAIGGLPLAMGLACGNQVLMVAVLAILVLAPIGAKLIDYSYQSLLSK